MGAADAVSAVIDAVTTKSADAVREAAAKFNEDTKSDIRSLGDASGRTPLHLVRPKHRPCTSYSRGEEIHGTPTTSRPTAARSGFLLKRPGPTGKRERRTSCARCVGPSDGEP